MKPNREIASSSHTPNAFAQILKSFLRGDENANIQLPKKKKRMYQRRRKAIQRRCRGRSRFQGELPRYKMIRVESGKCVTIKGFPYHFTGGKEWEIVDRFLSSLDNGDNHDKKYCNNKRHFPVKFTTADFNICKNNCRSLIIDWVERQLAAIKNRNARFEPRARFKVENLR